MGTAFGDGWRLFVVDEGGATTHVLAKDEVDAVRVLLEAYGYADATPERIAFDLGWEDGRPVSVELADLVRCGNRIVHDDDGGKTTLLAACRDQSRRGVVCSSEW